MNPDPPNTVAKRCMPAPIPRPLILARYVAMGRLCKRRCRAVKWRLTLSRFWTECAAPRDPPSGCLAQVAELVDAQVSGTCGATREGSSPFLGTISKTRLSMVRPQPAAQRACGRFAKCREWRQDGAHVRIDR